ncbi:MAG: Gfo/Idh/MocA family oxidoreductase [Bacillota bacterium]|nr:Gfo/Idh/MocA family oxidoreductase [Bacillota bacterium]
MNPTPPAAPREIRVALIGTGVIAHTHARDYARIPGVTIVAACDLNEAKLDAFCRQYDIPHQYLDYRRLLERDDIEVVDVCLHNNLHAPISVAVMAAGKHCYCEKPMAGAYTDALAMHDAARHYNRRLHIQLGMIYGGQTHAARTLIANGRLGRIYHARSYGYRRRGRPYVDGYAEKEFDSTHWAGHGALYDMGVYHISRLLYLLGRPRLESVSGAVYQELAMDPERRAESGFDVEELGVGFAKYENGLTLDILESWAVHASAFPPSVVYGSEGGIEISADGRLGYYSELDGYMTETTLDVAGKDYRDLRFDPLRRCYENSQAHFIAALRGECEAIDTAGLALDTMLVSEGIFLSSQLGREVTADEIPGLSRSLAIREQETPFGNLVYPPWPFISE